jgi:hypothetical protein
MREMPKAPPVPVPSAPEFLRELQQLTDSSDERTTTLTERIQTDILELVLHVQRRRLGVTHG